VPGVFYFQPALGWGGKENEMFDSNARIGVMLDEAQTGGGSAGAGEQTQQNGQQQPNSTALSYETWISAQPDEVRKLLDSHTSGLKSALTSERERNKTLEKDLRDAASKVDKGSEAEKKLTALADQVTEANQKTSFYEGAVVAGVNNLKLAWMAAKSDDLFKRDGSVDFDTMKKSYPELFGGSIAARSNNGGAGNNGQQPHKGGMNDYIRRAAGKQ
jgi:hypothetical protein